MTNEKRQTCKKIAEACHLTEGQAEMVLNPETKISFSARQMFSIFIPAIGIVVAGVLGYTSILSNIHSNANAIASMGKAVESLTRHVESLPPPEWRATINGHTAILERHQSQIDALREQDHKTELLLTKIYAELRMLNEKTPMP